ncbi:MAG: hypothetical protein R6W06_13790 [Prochlorococcaceae cyanobacterium]
MADKHTVIVGEQCRLLAVGEVVWQLEPDVLGLQLRCLDASNGLGINPIAKSIRCYASPTRWTARSAVTGTGA